MVTVLELAPVESRRPVAALLAEAEVSTRAIGSVLVANSTVHADIESICSDSNS